MRKRPQVDAAATENIARCDVRCMGCCKRWLWVAERSGRISVRDSRSGTEAREVVLPSGVFVNAMQWHWDHMWLGTTDGRLRAFSPDGSIFVTDVDLNRGLSSTSITALCAALPASLDATGAALVAGCASGEVFAVSTRVYDETILRVPTPEASQSSSPQSRAPAHPVVSVYKTEAEITALCSKPGVLYVGTGAGQVACVLSGETHEAEEVRGVHVNRVHNRQVSSLLWVPQSDTLWAAAGDGRIAVLAGSEVRWSKPLATLTQHVTRETVGVAAGGGGGAQRRKIVDDVAPADNVHLALAGAVVVSGGADGCVALWKAHESSFADAPFGLLGVLDRHHGGGALRCVLPVSVVEHSKIWTYGSDRRLVAVDVPAVSPAAVTPEFPSFGAGASLDMTMQLFSKAIILNGSLKTQLDELKASSAVLEKRNRQLEDLLGASKKSYVQSEEATLNLMNQAQLAESRKYTLDKEVFALKEEVREAQQKVSELLRKAKEQDAKLAESERRTAELESNVQKETGKTKEATADRDKHQKESTTHTAKVKQLQQQVDDKSKSLQNFTKQLSDAKDETLKKDVLFKKIDAEKKELEKTITKEKSRVATLEAEVVLLENNVKVAKESTMVKTNEIIDLVKSRDEYKAKLMKAANDLSTAVQVLEAEMLEKRDVADTAILARNEVELLRRERDDLANRAEDEKSAGMDTRGTVHQLRSQLTTLQDALNQERTTTKMLEDQYSVFQFVINSRGELVTAIWSLQDLLKRLRFEFRQFESHLSTTIAPLLKIREREANASHTKLLRDTLQVLDDKNTYIVANYFTEYEKLHFGISSYHYYPDTRRPLVVGDELFDRLQQVTPSKQTPKQQRIGSPFTVSPSNYFGSPQQPSVRRLRTPTRSRSPMLHGRRSP
ncbi:hypothetical protein DIPPA_18424 [Diplonema papillatum]|nr:hypothetical protein DIPPA_18424 [Diplonema papillatum]